MSGNPLRYTLTVSSATVSPVVPTYSDHIPAMKPALLSSLGLVAAFAVEAQGVFNSNNNYTPAGATSRAFVRCLGDGVPLPKAVGRIEYVLPDGTSLTPGGRAGVPLVADGLFFINLITVPGVPVGGTANIIVRAWDSSTGATYDAALARGQVSVTITDLGGGNKPPATFALNSNFTGMQFLFPACIIPEPSTYALAVMGAMGLFLVARRKK